MKRKKCSFSRLDTLTLLYNGQQVPVTNLGIAWTTDKAVKFRNPSNASNCKFQLNISIRINRLFRFSQSPISTQLELYSMGSRSK